MIKQSKQNEASVKLVMWKCGIKMRFFSQSTSSTTLKTLDQKYNHQTLQYTYQSGRQGMGNREEGDNECMGALVMGFTW